MKLKFADGMSLSALVHFIGQFAYLACMAFAMHFAVQARRAGSKLGTSAPEYLANSHAGSFTALLGVAVVVVMGAWMWRRVPAAVRVIWGVEVFAALFVPVVFE